MFFSLFFFSCALLHSFSSSPPFTMKFFTFTISFTAGNNAGKVISLGVIMVQLSFSWRIHFYDQKYLNVIWPWVVARKQKVLFSSYLVKVTHNYSLNRPESLFLLIQQKTWKVLWLECSQFHQTQTEIYWFPREKIYFQIQKLLLPAFTTRFF